MAKIMSEGYFSHDEAFGTFAWAAPELLLNDRCTDKVDIYRCQPSPFLPPLLFNLCVIAASTSAFERHR